MSELDHEEEEKENVERLSFEAASLAEIYGDKFQQLSLREWNVVVSDDPYATLTILLPVGYPSSCAPSALITAPFASDNEIASMANSISELYQDAEGEIVFEFAERVKEQLAIIAITVHADDLAFEHTLLEANHIPSQSQIETSDRVLASIVQDNDDNHDRNHDHDQHEHEHEHEYKYKHEHEHKHENKYEYEYEHKHKHNQEHNHEHKQDDDDGDHDDNDGDHGVQVAAAQTWTFEPESSRFKQPRRKFALPTTPLDIHIHHGELIVDRKSRFQAHVAEVTCDEHVQWVYSTLLQDKQIAQAAHNVTFYRYFDDTKNVVAHDNDDDGEAGAGTRLAEMMHRMKITNVFVMVTRWYGGIKLGPDRFRHFNNAAKQVLRDCGFDKRADNVASKSKKKEKSGLKR